jgi:hypothetical protein
LILELGKSLLQVGSILVHLLTEISFAASRDWQNWKMYRATNVQTKQSGLVPVGFFRIIPREVGTVHQTLC